MKRNKDEEGEQVKGKDKRKEVRNNGKEGLTGGR
jgi:hypothetical protein